jgi:UDP-N-acetylmuramate--alanine ligase
MLAELMRLRFSIAVAGAHGKTTTTSMIALVLERAGLDPTAVIGGRLSAFGSNARLGHGEYMVAEADESDRSFLKLWPSIAVVTNIDREHMESYGSFEDLQNAFVEFANRVPFYGAVVACADDPNLAAVLPHVNRPLMTYGLENPAAQLVATDVELGSFGGRCVVHRRTAGVRQRLGVLELIVPGRHNIQNALAVVAVAEWIGLDFDRVASALGEFHGAERRFERHGEAGGVLVVDDYGHHPTEIAATLAAARGLGGRVLVLFQPHRYSRTQALRREFGTCFADADRVWVLDIYAAGETPIPGISAKTVVESAREQGAAHVAEAGTAAAAVTAVAAEARPGDTVLTLGAGDVWKLGDEVLRQLGAPLAKVPAGGRR